MTRSHANEPERCTPLWCLSVSPRCLWHYSSLILIILNAWCNFLHAPLRGCPWILILTCPRFGSPYQGLSQSMLQSPQQHPQGSNLLSSQGLQGNKGHCQTYLCLSAPCLARMAPPVTTDATFQLHAGLSTRYYNRQVPSTSPLSCDQGLGLTDGAYKERETQAAWSLHIDFDAF